MRKKILITTNIPAPYRVDFFCYLQNHVKEYDIHVLFSSESEDNRRWNADEKKLSNTHYLKTKSIKIQKRYDTKYIYFPVGIGKELKNINPDIIIGWEYNPVSVQIMAWCRIHKRRYITLTDGTLHSERNINIVQKITRKYIISKCDAAIASSTKAKEKLLSWGISEKKVFLSLLTVDIEPYINIHRVPVSGRLLYVGSMIQRKGLDLLISALKYVNCQYELRIVGNGSEEEIRRLKQQIENEGLTDSVLFCGYKEGKELIEEYQYAEAFVFPTREDCFGLVLVEALAAKVPIISSIYADGAYDIIEDGINGLFVDPYNAKAFAKSIDYILGKKMKWYSNADAVNKFLFQETVKGYKSAIQYVCSTN